MSTKSTPWFVVSRAEDLAYLTLTDHPELHVEREPKNSPFDLLARILDRGRPSVRMFGIEVKGITSEARDGKPIQEPASWAKHFERFRDAAFPICLFVFNIETGEGFFRWICEPNRRDKDSRGLQFHPTGRWQRLDAKAVHRLIEDVRDWYDAGKRQKQAS